MTPSPVIERIRKGKPTPRADLQTGRECATISLVSINKGGVMTGKLEIDRLTERAVQATIRTHRAGNGQGVTSEARAYRNGILDALSIITGRDAETLRDEIENRTLARLGG